VRVPACGRALPGDRIAVDTAETGEHQPPRAGRISSKSGVSGSGGVCRAYRRAVLRPLTDLQITNKEGNSNIYGL